MHTRRSKARFILGLVVMLSMVALLVPWGVMAKPPRPPGPWWNVEPDEEVPSEYYDSILYSDIAPKLREIEVNSNRVKVDVIGQSAGAEVGNYMLKGSSLRGHRRCIDIV